MLANLMDAFQVLPGNFFKHIQVLKLKAGEAYTVLDVAECPNPALKDQSLNKENQTLRQRFARENTKKDPEAFSRAERTASMDRKRVDLIDRAIAHYERQYGAGGDAVPPGRHLWSGNGWY
jgi:hypothetical protein